MRRWLAFGSAALMMVAGVVVWRFGDGGANAAAPELPPSPALAAEVSSGVIDAPLVAPVATERPERSRQASRLARYDKDRDQQVSMGEYLANRRKSYDRLDKDGDGTLSFDEYAAKSVQKFQEADGDGSRELSPAEFAATAPKRTQRRECPPSALPEGDPFPA